MMILSMSMADAQRCDWLKSKIVADPFMHGYIDAGEDHSDADNARIARFVEEEMGMGTMITYRPETKVFEFYW